MSDDETEEMLRRLREDTSLRSSLSSSDCGLTDGNVPVVPFVEPHYGTAFRGFGGERKIVSAAPYRSILVAEYRALLDADPLVERFAAYPHVLTYSRLTKDGRWERKTYTPDVALRTKGGEGRRSKTVVVEVRADELRAEKAWREREPFIRHAYAVDHGVEFFVFGESEIRREPRLSNCKRLNAHRWRGRSDDEARRRLEDVLPHVLPKATDRMPIVDLVERADLPPPNGANRAFDAVANLILEGWLFIDHRVPLSGRSLVFRSPLQ